MDTTPRHGCFETYRDLEVVDIDDDGEPEVIGLSQESATVFYYDIPPNPRQSPWSRDCLHVVAEERSGEGVSAVDIDSDGQTELVAGTSIYRPDLSPEVGWQRETIASGWDNTRVAVADLDSDGEFEERTVATGVATHEAKATDLTGNGRPDVVGKSYGPDHHVDVWYNQG